MRPAPAPRRLPGGEPADGAPLAVFVHGLEDQWRVWSPVARALGAQHAQWECVALDLPWRAGNDYRWRWHGSPSEWLAAGLDGLAREPDLLVGHSFGANAALEAVARDRAGCRSLALVMPSWRPAEPAPDWDTWDRSRIAFEFQMREAVRARLAERRGVPDEELLDQMLGKVFDRIGLPGFLSVFEQYVTTGHLPLPGRADRLLVVGGERDPGSSRGQLAALGAAFGDATVHVEAEFDHFCHLSHPSALAGLLRDFAALPRSVVPDRR